MKLRVVSYNVLLIYFCTLSPVILRRRKILSSLAATIKLVALTSIIVGSPSRPLCSCFLFFSFFQPKHPSFSAFLHIFFKLHLSALYTIWHTNFKIELVSIVHMFSYVSPPASMFPILACVAYFRIRTLDTLEKN